MNLPETRRRYENELIRKSSIPRIIPASLEESMIIEEAYFYQIVNGQEVKTGFNPELIDSGKSALLIKLKSEDNRQEMVIADIYEIFDLAREANLYDGEMSSLAGRKVIAYQKGSILLDISLDIKN